MDNYEYERYRQRRNYNRRATHRKRTRNRIIIVSVFLLLVILAFYLITSMFKLIFSVFSGSSDVQETTASQTVEATTAPPDMHDPKNFVYNKPDIKDDGKTEGADSGGIYVWNKKGFELFYGTEEMAQRYAGLMNKAATSLGKKITTYSMIVPNHTEFGLPERFKSGENPAVSTLSQLDYVKAGYLAMSKDVIPVNAYNELSAHCNEYIYFSSDHHWTGLGAYYAYKAFADSADLKPLSLDSCEEKVIKGFTGTFNNMASVPLDTDDVHYWQFPYSVPDTITDSDGVTNEFESCYYDDASAGEYTYSVFLYGDNPLEIIKSSSKAASDEKIAVIHESYGNAFVPYLTYNYSEVYSIDFRSWDGNLKEFCTENDITNVLFLNGVMSSATQLQLDSIERML
ncbi:MAG: hypothetical protein IIZ36_04720 [Ruminococcus sp.]|nr:hypothetical protein [Ruminococcus sp.]